MRILIISPSSDPAVTALIQQSAEGVAAGEREVACKATPGASKLAATYQDILRCTPGVITPR